MHTPGHNPYLQQIADPYTFDFDIGMNQPIQLQLDNLYGYKGVNDEIMSTLARIFGSQGKDALSVLPGVWSGDSEHGWNIGGQHGSPMSEEWLLNQVNPSFSLDDGQLQMDYDSPEGKIYNWAVSDTSDENTYYVPAQEGSVVLEGLDFEGQPLGINIFDPESIASVLSDMGELGDAPIKAGEIQALTPEMLEKTESQYYSPYEEAERVSLVEKRGENIAGAETGGFAGSGGRRAGLSAADRMYSAGYGDIIADILKMKAGATSDVMDTIYGWQELLSDQTTTG